MDAKTFLVAEELDDTIQPTAQGLPASVLAKALQALRRHLDTSLRREYIQVEHPAELWAQLQARFLHEKTIFLPQARHEWMSLRVMDFPDISSFNSELHRIVAQLSLCGEVISDVELITKTLSTFPVAAAVLAQQYRNMRFRTHAKLMSFLPLAEKEQQIMLKNAEARLARDTSIVETHATETGRKQKPRTRIQRHQARRQVPPRDKSKPFASSQSQSQSHSRPPPKHQNRSQPPHTQSSDARHRSTETSLTRHRCGRLGHIVKNCRSSQYLVNLYKELQDLNPILERSIP